MITAKRQMAAVFDKMTITRAKEYRDILGLAEDNPNYQINLFLSKWGYLWEQSFSAFLEQYRADL